MKFSKPKLMKSLISSICLLTFLSTNVFAQMSISTNLRQDFTWDYENEEWSLTSTDEEELTFFEFNKDFTMFKHTTASLTSAYMIKSMEEDKEREQWELDIISDIGNNYLMIIDFNNENVRFISDSESDSYLVKHVIKSVWFDEEDE